MPATPTVFGIENQKEPMAAFVALLQIGHFPKLPIFRRDFEKRTRLLPIYPKVTWHEWQISFLLPLFLLYISEN
jgi:hypothetical protein